MSTDEIDLKMEEGFRRLREGDAEGALSIGRELEQLRHSSGFEIQALAYADLGDLGRAIRVLRNGVKHAPRVWLLWHLLGNNYSDGERYGDALQAYQEALHCPDVDTQSVHYNIATVLSRQDRFEEALEHLELAHLGPDPDLELAVVVTAQRIATLASLERYEEALACGRSAIARARLEGRVDEALAPVLAEYAAALWLGRRDRDGAEDAAREAIEFDRRQSTAMWVLRELSPRAAEGGLLYRLLLVGRWHEPLDEDDDPPGFYTSYQVVADSTAEALQLALCFEPPPVRDSVEVEECAEVEPRPGEPKGVYSVSGYSFFADDGE